MPLGGMRDHVQGGTQVGTMVGVGEALNERGLMTSLVHENNPALNRDDVIAQLDTRFERKFDSWLEELPRLLEWWLSLLPNRPFRYGRTESTQRKHQSLIEKEKSQGAYEIGLAACLLGCIPERNSPPPSHADSAVVWSLDGFLDILDFLIDLCIAYRLQVRFFHTCLLPTPPASHILVPCCSLPFTYSVLSTVCCFHRAFAKPLHLARNTDVPVSLATRALQNVCSDQRVPRKFVRLGFCDAIWILSVTPSTVQNT